MTTTVISTIGTSSRDYSTIQAWEDACPADLVSVDQIWKGNSYNDSAFDSASQILAIAGSVYSSTNYVWLDAAAGQSFVDHASKLTNPLIIDQTKGVAINSSGSYTGPTIAAANYSKFTRLQISKSKIGSNGNAAISGGHDVTINQCILEHYSTNNIGVVGGTGSIVGRYIVSNSLIMTNGGRATTSNSASYSNELYNCALVNRSGTSVSAVISTYKAAILKNCAVFGYTDVLLATATLDATSDYNSTDATAPTNWGAHSQNGKTFSNQFVSTTVDFRVKAGADLINAGTRDATHTNDVDIVGTARSLTTPTIGPWEYAAGGGAVTSSRYSSFEARLSLAKISLVGSEARASLLASRLSRTEQRAALSRAVISSVENTQSLFNAAPVSIESIKSATASIAVAWECAGSAASVSNSIAVPFETRQLMAATSTVAFVVVSAMARSSAGNFECVGVLVVSGLAAMEIGDSINSGSPALFEAASFLRQTIGGNIEAFGAGLALNYADLEMLLSGVADLDIIMIDPYQFN